MKKKPPKVVHFTQPVYPYRKEIFVCAGITSYEQLIKAQPKHTEQWWKDWLKEKKTDMEKEFALLNGGNKGFMFLEKHGAAIMALKPFEDTWEYWECLIHELSHYLDFLQDTIGVHNETEARAYLNEFLFREIRRKLMGLDVV